MATYFRLKNWLVRGDERLPPGTVLALGEADAKSAREHNTAEPCAAPKSAPQASASPEATPVSESTTATVAQADLPSVAAAEDAMSRAKGRSKTP